MMKAVLMAALIVMISSTAMATNYSYSGTSGNDTIYVGMKQTRPGSLGTFWTNQGLVAYRAGLGIHGTYGTPAAGSHTFTIDGFGGNDIISVRSTITINGTTRIVPYTSNPMKFIINGGEGDDTIYGSAGIDTLVGSAGSDTIYGGAGNDQIYGDLAPDEVDLSCFTLEETDEDICYGEAGNDIVKCSAVADGGDDTDQCHAFFNSGEDFCESDPCWN